jgi:hypothetical protein
MEQSKTEQVSFDDIHIEKIPFRDNFKVCYGTIGQLMRGMIELTKEKEMENDYQKVLYPAMNAMAKEVIKMYNEMFIDHTTDKLEKQIYGANLNGNYNNGQLPYTVVVNGLSYHLKYKFIQFGELLRVIIQRMEYIISRDYTKIERYSDDNSKKIYNNLQIACGTFLKFIHDDIYQRWTKTVKDARNAGGVKYASKSIHEEK